MKTPNLSPSALCVRLIIYSTAPTTNSHRHMLQCLKTELTKHMAAVLDPDGNIWTGEGPVLHEVVTVPPAPGEPEQITCYFVDCPKGHTTQVAVTKLIEEGGFKIMPWPDEKGVEVTMAHGFPGRAHLGAVLSGLAPAPVG